MGGRSLDFAHNYDSAWKTVPLLPQLMDCMLRGGYTYSLDVATTNARVTEPIPHVATTNAWITASVRFHFPFHRLQVDVLSNSGDTRLWDALQMAYTLIKKWKSTWKAKAKQRRAAEHRRKNASGGRSNGDEGNKNGNTASGSREGTREEEPIVRVLVLSDGTDTKSDASAHL